MLQRKTGESARARIQWRKKLQAKLYIVYMLDMKASPSQNKKRIRQTPPWAAGGGPAPQRNEKEQPHCPVFPPNPLTLATKEFLDGLERHGPLLLLPLRGRRPLLLPRLGRRGFGHPLSFPACSPLGVLCPRPALPIVGLGGVCCLYCWVVASIVVVCCCLLLVCGCCLEGLGLHGALLRRRGGAGGDGGDRLRAAAVTAYCQVAATFGCMVVSFFSAETHKYTCAQERDRGGKRSGHACKGCGAYRLYGWETQNKIKRASKNRRKAISLAFARIAPT